MDGHFSECVLCQIVSRELRAKVLYEDDLVLCLDLPKDHPVRIAPVHFLVVPKEHLPSAREAEARHEPALGRLVTVAARVAREMRGEATGYRLASHTGDAAGPAVFAL